MRRGAFSWSLSPPFGSVSHGSLIPYRFAVSSEAITRFIFSESSSTFPTLSEMSPFITIPLSSILSRRTTSERSLLGSSLSDIFTHTLALHPAVATDASVLEPVLAAETLYIARPNRLGEIDLRYIVGCSPVALGAAVEDPSPLHGFFQPDSLVLTADKADSQSRAAPSLSRSRLLQSLRVVTALRDPWLRHIAGRYRCRQL